MPPILRFCLTLAGTLLFGWPLWAMLTDGNKPPLQPAESTVPAREASFPAILTVRFTGAPARLDIFRGSDRIASLPPGENSPWEAEINLPEQVPTLTLRVEAAWNTPNAPDEQAVTLVMEPERQQAREATRWARGNRLNDIFSFSW